MARPGPRLRLVDVAERAGVSLATASRALAGRDGVSAAVANRVREISRELGYVANPYARTLAGGASSTVGLVVHQVDDPYFSEIAGGVIEIAGEQGLLVQICHSGRDPNNELRRSGTSSRSGSASSSWPVPAARLARRVRPKAELSAFQRQGGRVAVIGRHAMGVDAVQPDNEAGGLALGNHLLDLGHRARRRGRHRGLTTVADRLAGVAAAMRGHGLSIADLTVVHGDFTREGGRIATEQIMREHPATTAIIALNDVMAMGVLSRCASCGSPYRRRSRSWVLTMCRWPRISRPA